jgi:hypothetical protein
MDKQKGHLNDNRVVKRVKEENTFTLINKESKQISQNMYKYYKVYFGSTIRKEVRTRKEGKTPTIYNRDLCAEP